VFIVVKLGLTPSLIGTRSLDEELIFLNCSPKFLVKHDSETELSP